VYVRKGDGGAGKNLGGSGYVERMCCYCCYYYLLDVGGVFGGIWWVLLLHLVCVLFLGREGEEGFVVFE
jgi:hypothetical protein